MNATPTPPAHHATQTERVLFFALLTLTAAARRLRSVDGLALPIGLMPELQALAEQDRAAEDLLRRLDPDLELGPDANAAPRLDSDQAALLHLAATVRAIDCTLPLVQRIAHLADQARQHSGSPTVFTALGVIRELARDAAGTLQVHSSDPQPKLPERAAAQLRDYVRRLTRPGARPPKR